MERFDFTFLINLSLDFFFMYFFSSTDPNYRIKGSRDPLGFQTLWAAAGHRVVAHLSTVSVSLRDFMILSYAHYFYGDHASNRFIQFFLKFEQACAFARRIYDLDEGFNGVGFVNKYKDEDTFKFSLNPSNMLLSNQRAYGIYGKYIRPFRDIELVKDPGFSDIMEKSLAKTKPYKIITLINSLINEETTTASRDDLQYIADLIGTLTPEEKNLYRTYLLKVPEPDHPQNNLYEVVKNNIHRLSVKSFNLFDVINELQNDQFASSVLKSELSNIKSTDKVLHPLNRCFSHLLSRGIWSLKQIEEDLFFQSLPPGQDYDFSDETMRGLNKLLDFPKQELIDRLILRNAEIKENPWINKDKNGYTVLYGEQGQKQTNADFERGFEFPYFLDSYISLYSQIELQP